MSYVMITGSFDPVTAGHLRLIGRARALFPGIRVVMFNNPDKQYLFDFETRYSLLSAAINGMDGVTADCSCGRVVDYARANGITTIVRGIRDDRDLGWEQAQARYNRAEGGLTTLLLPAFGADRAISSTAVRDALAAGRDPAALLPPAVHDAVLAAYRAQSASRQ